MKKVTKQFKKRNAILTCLQQTDAHPSAEMVHEMLYEEHPDISLATIYRNLAKFKAEGTVVSVATVKGVERFDAHTDPHVHFICTGCDAVIDMPEIAPPNSLGSDARDGFRVDGCQLTFTGLCAGCNQ